MNSNQKGKRGERELASKIRECGFDARRGQHMRDKNGRFTNNKNEWVIKDGLAYCYLRGELLFFTEEENMHIFDGKSVCKTADGYCGVNDDDGEKFVHRIITDAKDGDIVDHINRNKKDNRKSNLRLVDKSVNAFNCGVRKSNKSGVTGVYFRKDTNRWQAEIKKDGKHISLGCYVDKETAIKAREKGETKYYGQV